jgi:hypothetical protein
MRAVRDGQSRLVLRNRTRVKCRLHARFNMRRQRRQLIARKVADRQALVTIGPGLAA